MRVASYPLNNQVACRFYFALRKLTLGEERSFEEGVGLPPGVGYDPKVVTCEITPPSAPAFPAPAVTRESQGVYRVQVLADEEGLWRYKGAGLQGDGTPVAASSPGLFEIGP